MRLPVILFALVLPLAACNKPAPQEPAKPGNPTVAAAQSEPAMSSHDPSSYAEPEKVVITHVALDLNVSTQQRARLFVDGADHVVGKRVDRH